MAPDEAALLTRIGESYTDEQRLDGSAMMEAYIDLGFCPIFDTDRSKQLIESMAFVRQFRACRDSLVAEQLIKRSDDEPQNTRYGLSSRGVLFLNACNPPTAKAS